MRISAVLGRAGFMCCAPEALAAQVARIKHPPADQAASCSSGILVHRVQQESHLNDVVIAAIKYPRFHPTTLYDESQLLV